MRKKIWTVIAVANDTRHVWSCLQKATDAPDAMRQCAAEMGAADPSNFQIIGAIRGDHDVIAPDEDGASKLSAWDCYSCTACNRGCRDVKAKMIRAGSCETFRWSWAPPGYFRAGNGPGIKGSTSPAQGGTSNRTARTEIHRVADECRKC